MSSSPPLPPGLPGVAVFSETAGGLASLRVTTALATAEVMLDGAHVTHFQPRDTAPVLFLSKASHFTPGQPIRGGVPVCFPWFSAHASRADLPAHGFARIRRWSVESLTGTPEKGATAVLKLASDEATRAQWPHDFVARLRVEVTSTLRLTLEVENTGAAPFRFEEALHTYFAISDVRQVSVTGLEGATYVDKTDGQRRKELGADPLRFTSETDAVFPSSTTTCVIDDPGSHRRIVVEKGASRSTIVWNPWIAKAAAMADFGDDEWPAMLCIETANVIADAVTLGPGETHAMTATLRLE